MQIRSNGVATGRCDACLQAGSKSASLAQPKGEKPSKKLYFCLNTELNFR